MARWEDLPEDVQRLILENAAVSIPVARVWSEVSRAARCQSTALWERVYDLYTTPHPEWFTSPPRARTPMEPKRKMLQRFMEGEAKWLRTAPFPPHHRHARINKLLATISTARTMHEVFKDVLRTERALCTGSYNPRVQDAPWTKQNSFHNIYRWFPDAYMWFSFLLWQSPRFRVFDLEKANFVLSLISMWFGGLSVSETPQKLFARYLGDVDCLQEIGNYVIELHHQVLEDVRRGIRAPMSMEVPNVAVPSRMPSAHELVLLSLKG